MVGLLALIALTFRPVVEGDGVGYYAYLHAILVSHSLRLSNEYSAAVSSHVPVYLPLVTTKTSTGRLADYFPIGSAVMAAPAYLVALWLRPSGEPQYGSPFVEAFTLASLAYGLMGLAISYRLASSVTGNRRAALVGVAGATVATPAVYYLLSDPSYSQTFSVFCVSAFLYLWFAHPPHSAKGWFGLGVLGGIMAMTRFQDGLLLAIVLVDARRLRWPALWLIPGVLIGFAPQFVTDQVQFNTWLPQRPPGQDLDLLHSHYLDTLFSSRDGVLVWSPVALVAVVGLIFIRDRRLQMAVVVALVLETLIIGAAPDPVGRSFGARRFVDLVPVAAVGVAAFAERFGPKISLALVGLLCAWNIVLEANFEYLMSSSPGSGYVSLLSGQAAALAYVPRLLAKGGAVRDLLLWSQSHRPFDPVKGILMVALEAASLGAAAAVAARPSTQRRAAFGQERDANHEQGHNPSG